MDDKLEEKFGIDGNWWELMNWWELIGIIIIIDHIVGSKMFLKIIFSTTIDTEFESDMIQQYIAHLAAYAGEVGLIVLARSTTLRWTPRTEALLCRP